MPELPEVEVVKRQLKSALENKTIKDIQTSGLSLRKPLDLKLPKKIYEVSRWGKRLFLHTSKNSHIDISLGMTGQFRLQEHNRLTKHDHLCLKLSDKNHLVYKDVRRFGWMEFHDHSPETNGWDPLLSSKKELSDVYAKMKASKKSLFNFLMSQDTIVGLGNIYVQEALFRAELSPFKPSSSLSKKDFNTLMQKTVQILKEALRHKGSTIINYRSFSGEEGGFQKKLKVYGKTSADLCDACHHPLTKVKLARTITYCTKCQKN